MRLVRRSSARADQALLGKARNENQAAITRLLAGLDHEVLLTRTAALPVGDPLYHFVGRVLLNRGEALPQPLEGACRGVWAAVSAHRRILMGIGHR